MKYLALICAFSVITSAADFQTGQAARITIGQVTFTSQDEGAPSAFQLGGVSGIAYANNSLFVVDSNHIQATPVSNRVLIYNNISRFILPPTSDVPQGVRCPLCVGAPSVGGADLVLGQADFNTTDINLSQTGFRTPTGVATDGKILVVADTDNNRILLWKTIPTSNQAPADIVLGQVDFKTFKPPTAVNNTSFRGPEGVWIQGTRLFVADTQNSRVMVWNNIPTSNNQPADVVLGEPDFNTAPPPTTGDLAPTATNMFSPVSVTSDGQRLFVTDLGHSRVMVWNSIPTQNNQAADLILGQPDGTSEVDNNAPKLCPSIGPDDKGNPTYPFRCAATMSFPRFALSDGRRLFVADGGNDRILVWNSIPTTTGQRADIILGQPDEVHDVVTDSADTFRPDANILRSSPDTVRTPLALAWDGTNLFVTDPFDRRVLVFTLGEPSIPINGITNAASRSVFALGAVNFAGTITAGDIVTVTINATDYKYTVVKDDTLAIIEQNFVDLINGKASGTPDPNVVATLNPGFDQIVLTAKVAGLDGNNITLAVTTAGASSTAAPTIAVTTSGGTLNGGQSAAEVAPGTLVSITGVNLSETTASGTPNSQGFLPTKLAGVQVYFDGIKAPLIFVSPTQINTQIPIEVSDSSGISAFVRTEFSDGRVVNTTAIAVPIVLQNPGIFAAEGADPRPVLAFHSSSNATGVVSIDGSITANDTATITIEDRPYTYTVQSTDAIATVRDGLVALINGNPDEKVTASPSGQFTRILLTAKVGGPDGNGIPISGSSSASATIIVTALSSSTCCASVSGAPITLDNPAAPGEIITIYATGIGLVTLADGTTVAGVTGQAYNGPSFNTPEVPVDNAQVGGLTANVINVRLKQGLVGVYEIQMQLASNIPTNANTQMFIAQSVFTSNIVTIPVVAPSPPQ